MNLLAGSLDIWVFPKVGVKPPKWMVKIMENPTKMDDLGVSLFSKHPYKYLHASTPFQPTRHLSYEILEPLSFQNLWPQPWP